MPKSDLPFGSEFSPDQIDLQKMYDEITKLLEHREPIYILDLLRLEHSMLGTRPARFTEWEWRIIRFALERAKESI
jgi:hypothetical protein